MPSMTHGCAWPVLRWLARTFFGSCPGEADQELARASASDPTGRTFVFGKDSDYFVFEGCRYIQFNTIEVCIGERERKRNVELLSHCLGKSCKGW